LGETRKAGEDKVRNEERKEKQGDEKREGENRGSPVVFPSDRMGEKEGSSIGKNRGGQRRPGSSLRSPTDRRAPTSHHSHAPKV
jgi:hypothetical protein